MEVMYKLSCQSIHPLSQTDNTSGKAYLTHRHESTTRASRCLRSPANPISSLRSRQDSPDRQGVFCECLHDTTAFCPGCCILDITGITESPSLKTMRTYNALLQTFPFCQDIAFLIYSAWELRANVKWARSAKVTKVVKLSSCKLLLQSPTLLSALSPCLSLWGIEPIYLR